MGYDILTKVIEITDADIELLRKLKKGGKASRQRIPFDACAVYEWNDKEKFFKNVASFGGRGRNVARYETTKGFGDAR